MEPQKSLVLPLALTALVSAIIFGGLGYYVANSKTTSVATVTPTTTTRVSTTVTPTTKVSTSPTASSTVTPDPTADWKTYTNTTFKFSIKYPSSKGWKIDTSTIDKLNSAKQGFDTGGAHFAIEMPDPGKPDTNIQKVEFSMGLTTDNLEDYIKTESIIDITSRPTYNTIKWVLGKSISDPSAYVDGAAIVDKSYPNIASANHILIGVTGYEFTGSETSDYSTELAHLTEQVLSTFKFTN